MPDVEKKKRADRPSVRIPKPNAAAEDVQRDETNVYGDEADIPLRKRRKSSSGKGKAGKARRSRIDPLFHTEADETRPARGKKKKKRRVYRSLFDLMNATGADSLFRSLRIFGREIRFWPLFVLALIVFLAFGVMLNNGNLSVTEQRVTIVGLPEELENYRIIVLSDLNGKRFGDSQSLLLRTINNLNYNAIFCVGDMVGPSGNAEPFYEFLDGLRYPERVYFICGDADPGPFVQTPRNITGTLSQIVLEDWILGAIQRGANYVDAPMQLSLKGANLWISPATMLNLETVSTVEAWKEQTSQEQDGVIAGISADYNSLPMTDYRYQQMQKLYDAQRVIGASDIHISLAHERPSDDFIYTSESHDPLSERYLRTPELLLAGHYCNGVWRIPFVGALYVPDETLDRNGWLPEQSRINGLSSVDDTQVYVTGGLSSNSDVKLMPFRLFNSPEISVLTLTSTLPENMLEAG